MSYGVIVGLVLWLPVAVVYSPMTRPERAKPRSYGDLKNLVGLLRTKCQSGSKDGTPARATAYAEADAHLGFVEEKLDSAGMEWVNGSGYMVVWQRAHRAEETLVGGADEAELYAEALKDELQLDGSTIPNRKRLEDLVADAKRFFQPAPHNGGAGSGGSPVLQELDAVRIRLKEVRHTINEFRDTTWNGLLQLRNQTMSVLILTEIATFILLGVAVLGGASPPVILAAVAFFLVGASVGLFNRLYQQAHADTAVEDYGLTTVGLLSLPVYSGLAGIGGVMLFSLGSQPSVAPGAGLEHVFDLRANSTGLVVAAVFGVAPGLLLRRLGELAESYKRDLRSTNPSSHMGDYTR